MLTLMFWLLLVVEAVSPSLTIRVNKNVLMSGESLWVTCMVPDLPPSSQYQLEVGIVPERSSVRQIDHTPTAIATEFKKVTCDAEYAYCALHTGTDDHPIVTHPIVVAGCRE